MTKLVDDGYWYARFEGPTEIVEVKNRMVFRFADRHTYQQHSFKFEQPVQPIRTNVREFVKQFDPEPEGRTIGEAEALHCAHAFDEVGLGLACVHCGATLEAVKAAVHAVGNAELDAGVPNHYDPNKRGFNPR
jgi:hypothetical protein